MGLAAPSTDFGAVRDRRRTGILSWDVDLSQARSITAGTALVIPIAGNVLYIDQRKNTGFATCHLVDDTFNRGNTPITLFAGFILKAPFTQLVIANEAQPGQTLRILYGVDVDFMPGIGAGVTVTNPVNIIDVLDPSGRVDVVNLPTALGVNQLTTILTPAQNPRGARVRHAVQSYTPGAGGQVIGWLVASNSAPAAIATKANTALLMYVSSNTSVNQFEQLALMNREIPPDWGVYHLTNVVVAIAAGNVLHIHYEVK
jgi:hypothetical protein